MHMMVVCNVLSDIGVLCVDMYILNGVVLYCVVLHGHVIYILSYIVLYCRVVCDVFVCWVVLQYTCVYVTMVVYMCTRMCHVVVCCCMLCCVMCVR